MDLYNILALIPFLFIIYFLVMKGKQASKVMFGTYVFTAVMLLVVWKMEFMAFLGASVRGFGVALEIFLIIFSILLLFNLLKSKGKLDNLKHFMKSYTSDKNVLIILVGFFLVSFFESIAGFGTPAAIAVPILVFLGISPFSAIIICLVADSVAVAFGAFGIPVVYGIAQSVESANIVLITEFTGIMLGVIACFLPTLLLFIYNYFEKKSVKGISKYFPFSFFAGFSFGVPYIISSFYLSPELVSVVASIVGFFLTVVYLHFTKFLKKRKVDFMDLVKSFSAYFLVIVLLTASRANWFGFGGMLKKVGFTLALYSSKISFPFNLYSPGVLIFLAFVVFALIYKVSFRSLSGIFKESFVSGRGAFYTLLPTLAFVQILIYSNINYSGFESIPFLVAEIFSKSGYFYIFLAPLIGAFGAFIAGSATVSNLIFGGLQSNVASIGIYSESLLLALQTVGGSAGNMIAIHNIVAACSLVGLKNYESTIIKSNVKIVIGYCFASSLIALVIFLLF